MGTAGIFSDIVDHVYVLSHTKYMARRSRIIEELSRLGVDSYEFITQFDNPLDSMLLKRDTRLANIWMGHYRALKLGYAQEYRSIMVIEDDIAFLNNQDSICQQIDALEGRDYCMLNLDPISKNMGLYRNSIQTAKSEGLSGWGIYTSHPYRYIRSGGCYCMPRDTIGKMIGLCERSVIESKVEAMDMMYNYIVEETGKPMLYSCPNIAIQQDFSGTQAGRYTHFAQMTYAGMGLDMSKYNTL